MRFSPSCAERDSWKFGSRDHTRSCVTPTDARHTYRCTRDATGWSDKWSGDPYAYITGYPGLDQEASPFLADSGVVAFGADTPSVDSHHEVAVRRVQPAHMMCRERGILNMENLANVHRIPQRSFTFIGLPLKIRNGAGSPIRAVTITED